MRKLVTTRSRLRISSGPVGPEHRQETACAVRPFSSTYCTDTVQLRNSYRTKKSANSAVSGIDFPGGGEPAVLVFQAARSNQRFVILKVTPNQFGDSRCKHLNYNDLRLS